jgi:hypothetical protein
MPKIIKEDETMAMGLQNPLAINETTLKLSMLKCLTKLYALYFLKKNQYS